MVTMTRENVLAGEVLRQTGEQTAEENMNDSKDMQRAKKRALKAAKGKNHQAFHSWNNTQDKAESACKRCTASLVISGGGQKISGAALEKLCKR